MSVNIMHEGLNVGRWCSIANRGAIPALPAAGLLGLIFISCGSELSHRTHRAASSIRVLQERRNDNHIDAWRSIRLGYLTAGSASALRVARSAETAPEATKIG